MRYKRLSFLLVVSLVFFLSVSLILIIAWFYYYFHDNKTSTAKIPVQDSLLHQKKFDSLQNLYTASIGTVDTLSAFGNDSLRTDINNKLAEFYRLRNEVNVLLKSKNNPGDLEAARVKIDSLQQKIDELKTRTLKVEYENKRLSAMLQHLSNELKVRKESARKPLGTTAVKTITEKPEPVSLFSISDIKISALSGEESNQETTSADQASKISGTFNVRSNVIQSIGNELMVVIIQPDGRVLQSSSWESGTFETREGKKIYSTKVEFDYHKGEMKQLSFTITADEFQKGEYTLLIYQNGTIIGRSTKYLN